MERQDILSALQIYISQRSGIDARNYRRDWNDKEGHAAFMSDYREILRHGMDARAMLRAVELSSIPLEVLRDSFSAYSGRLSYVDGKGCDYTAGQYFCTEYRAAACAVLAQALWRWYGADDVGEAHKPGHSDRAKAWAKRNLGRGIAGRWFR